MSYTHITPKNEVIEVDSWMSDKIPSLDFLNGLSDLREEALTFEDEGLVKVIDQFLDSNCKIRDREIAFKHILDYYRH